MVVAGSERLACGYLLSPTLQLCSLYRRNEEQNPEKCWDSDMRAQLSGGPRLGALAKCCPNNTTRRRARDAPIPFKVRPKALSASERKILELGPEKVLEDENEAEVEYA